MVDFDLKIFRDPDEIAQLLFQVDYSKMSLCSDTKDDKRNGWVNCSEREKRDRLFLVKLQHQQVSRERNFRLEVSEI